jgi:hypothetical protein
VKAVYLVVSLAGLGVAQVAHAQVATGGQFQAQPSPYGRPMQSAGLSAPPPFTLDTEKPDSADALLDEARAKDSHRGVSWFYVDATGGFEHAGLRTFNTKDASLGANVLDTVQSGGAVGGGIGARLVYVNVGAEGRVGIFNAWKLGRVGGAVGMRLPFGIIDQTLTLSGGYAGLAGLNGPVTKLMSVHGGYARAAMGVDVYPVSRFSIGAETSLDVLALKRPAVSSSALAGLPAGTITSDQATLLATDGSSVGATFALTAVIGLHL